MYNIAVTGVGGGVGQSVLKSLYGTGYNLISLDGDALAAGLYAASSAYLIPYANHPAYISSLIDICKKEKIALLFPGLDAELMPLALNKEAFRKIGTTVVVSTPNVISIADNKQETYDKLTAVGISVPFTIALEKFAPPKNMEPVIVKQKIGGARSKNVFLIKSQPEWHNMLAYIGTNNSNFIVQEYIEGDEYTCGTVCLDGKCKGVIIMRRILRDGDTYKCFTVINPVIENAVRRVVEYIKPFGACNIQLRMNKGVPTVFEINARCSGTTASRTLCGFNEPKMIADYLLNGIEPAFEIKEQTILRYWKELIVQNDAVSLMEQLRKTEQKNYTQL